MKRLSVQGGELLSVGYDAELQILEVEFSDHNVYQLLEVTAEVYAALMSADNKYKYYMDFIDLKYAGHRVFP